MPTEFGNKVKTYMSSLNMNGVTEKEQVLQKREKRKTVYSYSFEVSGVDMIATYNVSGKEKMKLILLLSQAGPDGNPICFIQEKGQNLLVDEASLNSFLKGLTHTDCFADGYVDVIDKETGEVYEPMPKMYKNGTGDVGNRFTRCFLFMVNNKKFIEHIKLGVVNFEIFYSWVDYKESRSWSYGRDTYYLPWFFNTGSSSYYISLGEVKKIYTPGSKHVFDEEKGEMTEVVDPNYYPNLIEDNLHLKMFRAGIKHAMEAGMSKLDALYAFYTNRSRGHRDEINHKDFTIDTFECFLILANRYDEPYATECMLDYLTNPKLDNFDEDKLDNLLRINTKVYQDADGHLNMGGGYFSGYTIVPGSLIHYRLSKEKQSIVLNLDKNRLWDYILFNSSKGLGKNLSDMLTNWIDYCTTTLTYRGKLSDKYPEHLKEAHDIVIDMYKELKAFTKEEKLELNGKIGQGLCDMKIGDYTLHIFSQIKEFLDEASYMNNCLARADYAGRVADGIHWIGTFKNVKDPDRSIFTVEISPATGMMTQIKCRYNHLPENDGVIEEMKVLKKIQDKIYKNMMDAGIIDGPSGYHYEFDFILKNKDE